MNERQQLENQIIDIHTKIEYCKNMMNFYEDFILTLRDELHIRIDELRNLKDN